MSLPVSANPIIAMSTRTARQSRRPTRRLGLFSLVISLTHYLLTFPLDSHISQWLYVNQ